MKWILWSLAVAFYFYEFVARVFPSVMVNSLMLSFDIDATAVGGVSALYFYTYAPMQIPVGVLMDRYGARKLLSGAALIAGGGCFLFGFAHGLGLLAIGRLLIGFGSAFGFVGMLYICTHLFPEKRRALLVGIGSAAGFVGAVVGEGPISLLETTYGWRDTVFGIGSLGILLGCLLFWAGRQEITHRTSSLTRALKGFWYILTHAPSWINGLIAFFLYAATSIFGALWGVPFLQETHQLSRSEAGFATSMIYAGWIFGGPIIGYISDRMKKRRPMLWVGSLTAGLLTLPLIYLSGLPLELVVILLFLIGFFSGSELLCFSYAVERHGQKNAGSALAFTNFIVMMGGAFFQQFAGWLLDFNWSGTYLDGVKEYSASDYQLAMTCLPIFFFLGFIFTFFLREPNR